MEAEGKGLLHAAEAKSVGFHKRLADGNFDAKYRDASPFFRMSASADQLRSIVQHFYGQPVECDAGKVVCWEANKQPSLTTVVLVFVEQCGSSNVRETLTWETVGDTYALQKVAISPQLPDNASLSDGC